MIEQGAMGVATEERGFQFHRLEPIGYSGFLISSREHSSLQHCVFLQDFADATSSQEMKS